MMHNKPQRSEGSGAPLDHRIDEALKERYQPPSTDAILRAAGVASTDSPDTKGRPSSPGPSGPTILTVLAAAAALAAGVFFYGKSGGETAVPQDERVAGWITKYDDLNDGGAVPACDCDPPCESFADHCYQTFAHVLDIPAEAAVELLGPSCCDPNEGSVSLAARCGEETVCLFVLLREAAPIIHEKLRRGLSIHRRDFGALSAFELSSQSEPAILPHLVLN